VFSLAAHAFVFRRSHVLVALRAIADRAPVYPNRHIPDCAPIRAIGPGETGERIWRFTKAGTFDFACLQPGHFEAGMIGVVSAKWTLQYDA